MKAKVPKLPTIIQIYKKSDDYIWRLVTNTDFRSTEARAALRILSNSFNKYMEYGHSGVMYRFIRVKDKSKYIED